MFVRLLHINVFGIKKVTTLSQNITASEFRIYLTKSGRMDVLIVTEAFTVDLGGVCAGESRTALCL